jgi:hypothetical protein
MRRASNFDWEKVSIAMVRERLESIESIKNLPGEVLDGLAKAICVTRPHPPEFGRLITKAKEAITALTAWVDDCGDDPAFNEYLKGVTNRLDAKRQRLMAIGMIYQVAAEWPPKSGDKNGASVRWQPPKSSEWPITILMSVPNSAGQRKHLDAMLVLGLGILLSHFDAAEGAGSARGRVKVREKSGVVRASELMAKILDEIWCEDPRVESGHVPANIRKQYAKAKKTPLGPKESFLNGLKETPVSYAWLPGHKIPTEAL